MKNLTPDQYQVLLGRIERALFHAKYTPVTVAGEDGPKRVAEEILRPYQWRDKRKWVPQEVQPREGIENVMHARASKLK